MKSISSGRLLTLFAGGLLLSAAALPVAAVDTVASTTVSSSGVRVTSKDQYKDFSFGKLHGMGIRGADGKQLGSVRDLVLDVRSGEPKFVLVSGGGLAGIGSHTRLLPFEALIREPKEHDFLTRLQRVDWELLPLIDKADIDEGRLVLTTESRSNVTRLHDQPWAQAYDALSTESDKPGTLRYVFASALTDKPLYGDGEKVGSVEDLYVDPRGGPTLAIVDIDQDYVGAKHEYLVPLQALQAPVGKGRVHTTLAAADFREVAGVRVDATPDATREEGRWIRLRNRDHAAVRRDSTAVTERDRRLETAPAPTGFPSSYRANDQVNAQSLNAAAETIRERWSADPALKRQTLRVTAEQGRLVLDGLVTTPRLAEQAVDTARRVTTGIDIDNRIRVEGITR